MTRLGSSRRPGINSPAEAPGLQRWSYLKPRNVISTHRGYPIALSGRSSAPGFWRLPWPDLPVAGPRGSRSTCRHRSVGGAELSLSRIFLLFAQAPGQGRGHQGSVQPSERPSESSEAAAHTENQPARQGAGGQGWDLGSADMRQRPLPTRIMSLSCSVTSGLCSPSLGPHSSPGLGNKRIFLSLSQEIREGEIF